MQEPIKKSKLATASLILGIFFFLPLVPILALIFAIIALVKISQSKEKIIGEGKAIAGLVLGGIGTLLTPLTLTLPIILIISHFAPPPEEATIPFYSKYLSVYEFHPQYIRQIDIFQQKEEHFKTPITISYSTYSSADIFDLKTSANIKLYDTKTQKDNCRSKKCEGVEFTLHLKEKDKTLPFWISFKSKRLPQLYTDEPIHEGKKILFGSRREEPIADKDIVIIAIPESSVELGVKGFEPNRPFQETLDGWRLYCFDKTKCTGCCLNLEFTIQGDSPEINLEQLWNKF